MRSRVREEAETALEERDCVVSDPETVALPVIARFPDASLAIEAPLLPAPALAKVMLFCCVSARSAALELPRDKAHEAPVGST